MPNQPPNGSNDGLATATPSQDSSPATDAHAIVPVDRQLVRSRSRLEDRAIEEGDPRILEASLDGWTQDLHQPRITR